MIKLVASDLDGTLLLHKAQSLPEEIFSLIRQLEELGIMFVAASGRQYPNMTKLFAPVASEISYISENGALAVWWKLHSFWKIIIRSFAIRYGIFIRMKRSVSGD